MHAPKQVATSGAAAQGLGVGGHSCLLGVQVFWGVFPEEGLVLGLAREGRRSALMDIVGASIACMQSPW